MRIVDKDAIASFRVIGECEVCRRKVYPPDVHHVFIKTQMNGSSRLDVKENLVALCRIPCHHRAEHDEQFANEIRELVAKREGTTVEMIYEWLWLILRTKKEQPLPQRPWLKASA